MLSLASCSFPGAGGGSQNGANEYDPSKPLIWHPDTDVSFVTNLSKEERQNISDKFGELTGIQLKTSSEDDAKAEHELVIGPTEREISKAAYHMLERNMTEDDDAEGYLVLVQNGSVAVAYSSAASYQDALKALYQSCCVPYYHADNGPVYWDFYSLAARAEQNRDAMYAEGFKKLEAQLTERGVENAKEIVREIKVYYSLFGTDLLYWLSDLYDPELGAFYYSNSGRDSIGYLPDIESTGQAFMMLDRSGLFDAVGGYEGNTSGNKLPEFIAEPMTKWLRGLQDSETGYFFHPQWGSEIASSRRARDLDNVVSLFKYYLGEAPYYNDPSQRLTGIYGAPGADAVKPASALSTRLGTSAIKAVSAITPTASTLPSYLQSLDAFKEYLESKKINESGVSYSFGNTLVSDWSLIKAAGTDYVTMVIDYLNRTQIPEIGLWEYQNQDDYDNTDNVGYNGTNGLMKICVLYGALGYAVPNAYNALQSTVKVALYPNTDPKEETVCYVLNLWTCISSMLANIKEYDPDNFAAASQLVLENAPEMLKMSYDLQHTHLMPDGGFSYFERRSMNVSQSAPVGCAQGPESDINATMVATSSTVGCIFGALNHAVGGGLSSIPIWGYDDYFLYMNELKNAGKVYKDEIPEAELIDFNTYAENDVVDGSEKQPHDNVNVKTDTNFFSCTVVQRPGSKPEDADLALRMDSFVETVMEGSSHMPKKDDKDVYIMSHSPHNAYVTMGNAFGSGNCYTVETDILFETADIGQILQIFFQNSRLGSGFNMGGIQFNTYQSGDKRYIRIVDIAVGLDGVNDYNLYENLEVGEWFNIKLEVYKVYVQSEGDSTELELYTKIYVDGTYVATTDCAYIVDGKVNDIEVDRILFSQYRYRASTVYIDNIITERTEKEYIKEWKPTDPTIPDIEIPEGEDYNYVAEFDGTIINDGFMFSYPGGVNGGKPGFDHTKYAHITDITLASDIGDRVGQVLKVHQKNNSESNGSWSYLQISNARPTGSTYTYETKLYYESIEKDAAITELYFDGKDANGKTITMLKFGMVKRGNNVVIFPYNNGPDGTGIFYDAIAGVAIPMKQWVTLRMEMYFTGDADTTRVKFFTDTSGEMEFASDFKLYHSLAAAEGIDGVIPVMNQLRIFHLRTNEAVTYYDDMSLTRTGKEYVKEVVRNEVTFDDGTILSSPAISINTGSAETPISKGDTEGGNDRNYYKIRTDLEEKAGDAVLEVYHKRGQNNAANRSDISIGITDGSAEGNIFIFEFDLKVNIIETYNASADFFARARIASAGNAGLYHDLTVNNEGKVICRTNGGSDRVLGDAGEWIHVKMIYNVFARSDVNNSSENPKNATFYLIGYDEEGNENLLFTTTKFSSSMGTNKDMSKMFLTGREGTGAFDQQYFLDNITYVRTADTSVIPVVPEA